MFGFVTGFSRLIGQIRAVVRDVVCVSGFVLAVLLYFGSGPAGFGQARADDNDTLMKLIDRQLDSIVRGTSDQIGVTLRDGSVIKAVRRNGHAIEIDVQLAIARTDSAISPSFQERRQKMQAELCSGETLKLIRSGVSWVYGYSDKHGRFMQSITIDQCP